jgi:hypothetical protein
MALFSDSGSLFDDWATAGSFGVINPGAAKDRKRAASRKEEGLRAEGDALRNEGLKYGEDKFKKLYGTDEDQVGLDMKDIIQRRKDMLNQTGNDFTANKIRQSGNDAVRVANSQMQANGIKGGMGFQAANAIQRQANRDVNGQLAQKYVNDLGASQDITGNLATQSQRLPQMYSQLFSGQQYMPPVGQAPFMGGLFDEGILGGIV